MTSMKYKKKKRSLSLRLKLEVFQDLKAGTTPSIISSRFSIARSTISEIKKYSGPKIEAFLLTNPYLELRKTMKSTAYPRLEKALKVFFDEQRALGKPISGTLLQEKARILQEKLATQPDTKETSLFANVEQKPKDVKLSEGFIQKFKKRHGIRSMRCVGEKGSADKNSVEPYIRDFIEMISTENFTRDRIYNADETGLCWRAIPTKTLAGLNELKVEGLKTEKERLTLMACANASGTHKLDLVFIYKYENPRALKHINKDKLPVKYYSQSKAWMTANLFEKWFNQEFVPIVRNHLRILGLEEKAVNALDNAPGHTKLSLLTSIDTKIHCIFFPPNTTSLIQPMDQGVLDTLKRHYKQKLIRRALDEDNEHRSMAEVKKSISIKDAIDWSAQAWREITPYTLRCSWNKILPPIEEPEVINQEANSSTFDEENSIADWTKDNAQDIGLKEMSDDEIIEFSRDDRIFQEEPIEESIPMPDILSIADAVTALTHILPTLENDAGSTREEILAFQNIILRWTRQLSSTN